MAVCLGLREKSGNGASLLSHCQTLCTECTINLMQSENNGSLVLAKIISEKLGLMKAQLRLKRCVFVWLKQDYHYFQITVQIASLV